MGKFLFSFIFISFFLSGNLLGKVFIAGKPYYSAPEVAKNLGMQFQWERPLEQVSLTKGSATLKLTKNKRACIINDVQVFLGDSVHLKRNHLYISERDLNGNIKPILVSKYTKKHPCKHIILDPGHGGKDHGTSNKKFNVNEKDLVLDLAYKVQNILKNQGYKVTLTRKNDTFIPLNERPILAERLGGDLFVSLHFNSVAQSQQAIQGIETYVLTQQYQPSTASSELKASDKKIFLGNKFNENNALLGYCIQNSLCKHLKSDDRGLKHARFAVLKDLQCPGILVEAGFLSNHEECKKIISSEYREKIAKCITKGIIDYDRLIGQAH